MDRAAPRSAVSETARQRDVGHGVNAPRGPPQRQGLLLAEVRAADGLQQHSVGYQQRHQVLCAARIPGGFENLQGGGAEEVAMVVQKIANMLAAGGGVSFKIPHKLAQRSADIVEGWLLGCGVDRHIKEIGWRRVEL